MDSGVLGVDNSLDYVPGSYIALPEPSGLAFGDNSLFVAYGSTLSRYDTTGALLDSVDFSAFADFGPLTFGGGKLFAGLTVATFGGDAYAVAAFDPFDLSSMNFAVDLDSAALGLVYGDGGLFVSEAHSIAKYDAGTGDKTAFLDLGALHAGPLAFIPQITRPEDPCTSRTCDPGGGVPEPGTWALMILGFGAAGVTLRQRRRLHAAAP
ncbi:MAG: hypothetical protein DI570_03150 [Phenylobacterium zucineum]|nr:MAG: hypothetical protein DI570_03150 [Phenylobacterium zucineum]